jgi:ribosomal protein L2
MMQPEMLQRHMQAEPGQMAAQYQQMQMAWDQHARHHLGQFQVRSSTPSVISAMDTNGDGMIDTIAYDTNGDGKIDKIEYDTNHDGNVDKIEYDTNRDGKVDTIHHDTNHDGKFDTIEYDTNHDGKIDKVEDRLAGGAGLA